MSSQEENTSPAAIDDANNECAVRNLEQADSAHTDFDAFQATNSPAPSSVRKSSRYDVDHSALMDCSQLSKRLRKIDIVAAIKNVVGDEEEDNDGSEHCPQTGDGDSCNLEIAIHTVGEAEHPSQNTNSQQPSDVEPCDSDDDDAVSDGEAGADSQDNTGEVSEYEDLVYEPVCKLSSNPTNSLMHGSSGNANQTHKPIATTSGLENNITGIANSHFDSMDSAIKNMRSSVAMNTSLADRAVTRDAPATVAPKPAPGADDEEDDSGGEPVKQFKSKSIWKSDIRLNPAGTEKVPAAKSREPPQKAEFVVNPTDSVFAKMALLLDTLQCSLNTMADSSLKRDEEVDGLKKQWNEIKEKSATNVFHKHVHYYK